MFLVHSSITKTTCELWLPSAKQESSWMYLFNINFVHALSIRFQVRVPAHVMFHSCKNNVVWWQHPFRNEEGEHFPCSEGKNSLTPCKGALAPDYSHNEV